MKRIALISFLIIAIALLGCLFGGRTYILHILIMIGVFIILGLSLDLVIGFTGYLSLGHYGLWAIGAYSSALLSIRVGLPFWVALILSGFIAAICAFLIGVPSFQLRGHYFVIVTLAFGEIIHLIIQNWISLTEGPMGLGPVPAPKLGIPEVINFTLDSKLAYFYLTMSIMLVTFYFMHKLTNSRIGRGFIAIREDETLARSMGLDVTSYKLLSFTISGFVAGIAGSVYAHYITFIGPSNFTISYQTQILTMVIVGGSGYLFGPILGALIFIPLPELLRGFAEYRLLIYGFLLLLVILLAPGGIMGGIKESYRINKWVDKLRKINSSKK